MAWNGIGTYVLPPAYSPEVNGTTIDATRYNGLTQDVATGVTQALNKNGENTPTTNISWGGFKLTSLGQPTVTGDGLAWGKQGAFGGVTGQITKFTTTAARGAGNCYLEFFDTTGQKGYFGWASGANDHLTIANSLTADIAFHIAGAERVRFDSVGNVAIGSGTVASRRMVVSAGANIYGRWDATAAATAYWEIFANGAVIGYVGSSDGTSTNAGGIGVRSETFFDLSTGGATSRMRVSATGVVIFGALSGASIGSGSDAVAINGTSLGIGAAGTGTAQVNMQASGFAELVNRTAGGGVKVYTNAGAVTAATFASNGDLTLTGNTTAKGVGITAVKTASTSRNTTTVLADDPDLVVAVGTGWWKVEVFIPLSIAVAGGANGWKMAIACTGTIANDSQMAISNDNSLASSTRAVFSTGQIAGTANSGNADWILMTGSCQITVAGNLKVQWAQNSSGAQNLTFNAGSYITATKLA